MPMQAQPPRQMQSWSPVQGQGQVQWPSQGQPRAPMQPPPSGNAQIGGPGGMPPMTNSQGMPPQGVPPMTNSQGMPQRPPPGPPPGGPPGGPPPGGVDQFAAYRQMLQNKGGAPMAKDKYDRTKRNAQMSYAEKYGTDYDPRGSMAWMQNPSKKDRRGMARVKALRAIGPQGRMRQAVDPTTGY